MRLKLQTGQLIMLRKPITNHDMSIIIPAGTMVRVICNYWGTSYDVVAMDNEARWVTDIAPDVLEGAI